MKNRFWAQVWVFYDFPRWRDGGFIVYVAGAIKGFFINIQSVGPNQV